MASMSILQLKEIAFVGGNIIISATGYSALQIKELVFTAKSKGASVTIRDAGRLSALQCKQIAFINPTKVTFDFS